MNLFNVQRAWKNNDCPLSPISMNAALSAARKHKIAETFSACISAAHPEKRQQNQRTPLS